VNLLLDTHIALWGLAGDPTLGDDFLDRLRHDPDIFLSPITIWEITIKQTAGKLGGPANLPELVRDMGFRELPVSHAHAVVAGRLPMHHRDPFDRMLIAQATVEGLTLVTRDADIHRYAVETLLV
jgi:PIN domain nuclease of toxin-antitoxin system